VTEGDRSGGAGLTLVTGGVRSGKSLFAERLVAGLGGGVLYVATGAPGDDEMAARIAAHRARRPAHWLTVEAPLEPALAIRAAPAETRVVLLDSLDMLVSNVLLAEGEGGDAARRMARLVDELIAVPRQVGHQLVVVTSECGLGLLPMAPLGRRYLDLLGDANQRLAAAADRVYLVVAGLAVDLRTLGQPPASGEPSA
jgi:adenosylcobinamide kinase / adenosylcobinamide-phosphate guanylyltransferase